VTLLEQASLMLAERRRGALATMMPDGDKALFDDEGRLVSGTLPPDLISAVGEAVAGFVDREVSGVVVVGESEVFVEALVPPPRLLLFGAGPIGEAVCAVAAIAGFTVEVGDPRPAFAAPERFPAAASVRCGWPDELLAGLAVDSATYVVSVLHEARFEDGLLPAVLRSPARHIGALGSRRTHRARVERLHDRGFTEEETARIRGPIGLAIGATTPEEIAVAIVGEMIAVRRGRGEPGTTARSHG